MDKHTANLILHRASEDQRLDCYNSYPQNARLIPVMDVLMSIGTSLNPHSPIHEITSKEQRCCKDEDRLLTCNSSLNIHLCSHMFSACSVHVQSHFTNLQSFVEHLVPVLEWRNSTHSCVAQTLVECPIFVNVHLNKRSSNWRQTQLDGW